MSDVFLYANRRADKELMTVRLKADRESADSYNDIFCVCDHVVVLGDPGF